VVGGEAGRRREPTLVSALAWPDPPAGFVLQADGAGALYVFEPLLIAVRSRGLDAWDGWDRELASGSVASGRGATAVVDGDSGTRWRLKAMRRGGRLASVWRDRYPSALRLVATLSASVEARARGIPTADPVALIVRSGPGRLVRGAMAFVEIERSEDFARLVLRNAATRADLDATIDAVRALHDRGVNHPDLNLGNILLRSRAGGAPEAFVIDFDRATFAAEPLPFGARQAALRRLERSCAKLTGNPGPFGAGSEDLWYTVYAGNDVELGRRLRSGRRLGRLSLAAHRAGWRRNKP
jgi:hypothetical protein